MNGEGKMICVLVADAGPFIKGAPLEQWSGQVVTTRDVIAEIRDKNTRERLQVLPYDLSFREPSTDSLGHVTAFAKKTGDYGALSPVDLRLLALTYQLHCELDPLSQLRQEPLKQEVLGREKQSANIAGFYSPKKRTKERVGDANPNEKENREGGADGECGDDVMCVKEMDKLTLEENCEGIKEEKEEENEEEEEENEGEDDDEGWITPENLRKACEEMGGVLDVEAQSLPVGCITTDYAMQNVLLQMGLNLISLEGKRIRQLRTYAKKCKGCFKLTMNTAQVWCPWCGNHSLYRVSVVVDSSGGVHYRPLSNKQFSHKGLKYPLPAPKSGRHAHNPVLAPDQVVTFRERRQRENKVDPLSLDYVARSSPFATHDVTSRGARVAMATSGRGRGDYRRRNPNAVQPKGRRKK